MKTLFRCLSAELLKTKRAYALASALALPTILSLFNFLLLAGLGSGRDLYAAEDGWVQYEHNTITFWALLVFTCVIVLATAFLAHQEHDAKTWRRLMCLPLPRAPIYLAKLLVTLALGLLACLVLWAENILFGALFMLIRPDRGLSLANIALWDMLVPYLCIVAFALLIVSFHLWLAMWARNFVLSIGVGFSLGLAGAFLHEEALWRLAFPWSLPALVYSANSSSEGIWGLCYSIIGFVVITTIGCLSFIRRDVVA